MAITGTHQVMRKELDRARELLRRAQELASGVVARGAIISVMLAGFGAIIAYASQVFISRSLGADQFGIYAYVLGWMGFVRVIVSLSLEVAAVRYVSKYFADGDWSRVADFLRVGRLAIIAAALIASVGCALAIHLNRSALPAHLPTALLLGCVLLLPTSLLTFEAAALQGLRLVYAPRIPSAFVRPLVIIAVLLFAITSMGWHGTAELALIANGIGVVVATVISYGMMRSRMPPGTRASSEPALRKEWFYYCSINLGQGILYMILSQQMDVVFVGSLVGTTNAGYYLVASQLVSIAGLGVVAVNQFVAPYLAEHEIGPQNKNLSTLLRRVVLLNALMALPLIGLLVVTGTYLLAMFGATFVAAYPAMCILLIGTVVNTLWGALWGDLLTMTGLHKEASVVVIIAAALNVCFTLYLTPRYGLVGAASATVAATLARSFMVAYLVHKKFGFWPWTLWTWRRQPA